MNIKTSDEIENNCIIVNSGKEEEAKLCMITEEFRQGLNSVKKLDPSVTFYGSARFNKEHPEYLKTYNLAFRIAKELNYIIMSGGGGGIMEAANKGGFDAGVLSVGLTIKLPHEQNTNPYVTKEIPFNFFFARQVSMDYTTEVCIFSAGGFGTLSELFELLTLIQTNKIGKIPVILYGTDFWNPIHNIIKEIFANKYKTINQEDVTDLYTITDDVDLILDIVKKSKIRNGDDSLI